MRRKDENKNQAIFDSTIQLINEIGFADISMSKIAKRAGLSSATIYVYYENKEDLLVKLYVTVKEKLSQSMLLHIHEGMDTKELVSTFMKNALAFMIENKDWFLFLEQFSASPFMNRLCLADTKPLFEPVFQYFVRGISKGDLKPVTPDLLLSYCYFPLVRLAKTYHDDQLSTPLEDEFELLFSLSWDAISQ